MPDAGTSHTLIAPNDAVHVVNVRPIPTGLRYPVTTASGDIIYATHYCQLPFQTLPLRAREALLVPGLQFSLLAISVLCDEGLAATYDMHTFTCTTPDNSVVLQGTRTPGNGPNRLWQIDWTKSSPTPASMAYANAADQQHTMAYANAAYQSRVHLMSDKQLVSYFHAVMGRPIADTLLEAAPIIKAPGLTQQKIRKNMPHAVATAQGHLKQLVTEIAGGIIVMHPESHIPVTVVVHIANRNSAVTEIPGHLNIP